MPSALPNLEHAAHMMACYHREMGHDPEEMGTVCMRLLRSAFSDDTLVHADRELARMSDMSFYEAVLGPSDVTGYPLMTRLTRNVLRTGMRFITLQQSDPRRKAKHNGDETVL